MFPLKHCLCVCIFWWFGSSPYAPALQLQLCHSHLVKEEYYIAPPSVCKRHNGTYIKTCTAEVFLPTNDFLHLSITTCEVFKTVSSTTFYFFGAKTHSDRTIAGSPPSIQACSIQACSLHPSLLVHYINSQGNLTLGQIYPDGNAYPGVRFIETYIPGRVFTFNIANHFYTFQNYCLTHSRSKVYRLSPTLAPVDVHFDPPNYEEISSLFPTSDFGFEDITSILRTINDANLIHERLTSFLLDRPTAETSANPNYLLDTASSALKSIFMQLISSITNPILNGIVSFLFLLSLFWAAVL